nr:MAG TPA: hypothetical protein [Caudoviricetes sp.]
MKLFSAVCYQKCYHDKKKHASSERANVLFLLCG